MKYSHEIIQYLKGEIFGYPSLPLKGNHLISRENFILNLTMNKTVLHIGCCDHIPNIMEKVKNKTWFHGLLLENCSYVAGIDIDKNAIEYVSNQILPIYAKSSGKILDDCWGNIYYSDITTTLPAELKNIKFDYIILGEVLEHIDNPVLFLKLMQKNLNGCAKKIIISVPSAYSFRRIINILSKHEVINSDHRYYFTPYTIAKVCLMGGIEELEELSFCDGFHKGIKGFVFNLFQKLKLDFLSILSNSLVLVGNFRETRLE